MNMERWLSQDHCTAKKCLKHLINGSALNRKATGAYNTIDYRCFIRNFTSRMYYWHWFVGFAASFNGFASISLIWRRRHCVGMDFFNLALISPIWHAFPCAGVDFLVIWHQTHWFRVGLLDLTSNSLIWCWLRWFCIVFLEMVLTSLNWHPNSLTLCWLRRFGIAFAVQTVNTQNYVVFL